MSGIQESVRRAPQYRVVGFLRTGGGFYISKHPYTATNKGRTRSKAHAWTMDLASAEDMVQRFHHVQAQGHYHQDVTHYDVQPVSATRRDVCLQCKKPHAVPVSIAPARPWTSHG